MILACVNLCKNMSKFVVVDVAQEEEKAVHPSPRRRLCQRQPGHRAWPQHSSGACCRQATHHLLRCWQLPMEAHRADQPLSSPWTCCARRASGVSSRATHPRCCVTSPSPPSTSPSLHTLITWCVPAVYSIDSPLNTRTPKIDPAILLQLHSCHSSTSWAGS